MWVILKNLDLWDLCIFPVLLFLTAIGSHLGIVFVALGIFGMLAAVLALIIAGAMLPDPGAPAGLGLKALAMTAATATISAGLIQLARRLFRSPG